MLIFFFIIFIEIMNKICNVKGVCLGVTLGHKGVTQQRGVGVEWSKINQNRVE